MTIHLDSRRVSFVWNLGVLRYHVVIASLAKPCQSHSMSLVAAMHTLPNYPIPSTTTQLVQTFPHALHYFEAQVDAFLVMEYIELTHSPIVTNLAERAAWALDWLSRVSAPPHGFFKDHKSPLAFSNIDALERYMKYVPACILCKYSPSNNIPFGQGRKFFSKLARNPAKPIVIINDLLIFTQSDMHVSNFSVDKCGNTVLLDFGTIGRLLLRTRLVSTKLQSVTQYPLHG